MYSLATKQIYVRKLFPHDIDHEVSVTKEIVQDFFGNLTTLTFYKGTNRTNSYIVTINNATDPRFGGNFKSIYAQDAVGVGDLLIIYKLNSNQYELDVVKKTDALYTFIANFFISRPNDRHAIIVTGQNGGMATPLGPNTPKSSDITNLYALRTKPFLLLAGISGTGKSRIVREYAYKSCPNIDDLQSDKTTPGNYLMVEVKPNWHDSSELLGYYSNISKKYILTPFIEFLVKAKKYPNVPFFVCLDEMNLAPVEQYFAEFLSVLETRRKTASGIKSGVLVEGKYIGESEDLTLPDNVFIIGTVNMDDTTHQFSRKVIDRAMTIEMNGENLENMFGHSSDLDYQPSVWTMDKELKVDYVSADEVIAENPSLEDKIKRVLPQRLEAINKCLKGTPFVVSYRVLNELVIYLGILLDETKTIIDDAKFDELVDRAIDQILLMKVLPRIEGDAEMFYLSNDEKNEINNNTITDKLQWLESICPDIQNVGDEMTAKKKIKEMRDRLAGGFTRYWP